MDAFKILAVIKTVCVVIIIMLGIALYNGLTITVKHNTISKQYNALVMQNKTNSVYQISK